MLADDDAARAVYTSRVRGSLILRIAVGAGAVIAGLIVMEIGLRVAGFAHASLYAPDERRGWVLRPSVTAWVGTEAGRRLVSTSAAGLRDREHAIEKPPGTVRIAVLGDSFTEALQVAAEETFWAVLERLLRSCPAYAGRAVEVINFGVGGYGTAQELLTWREQASHYAPDLVVLAFYTENDVLNNSHASNPTRPDETPYFVYEGDRLELQDRSVEAGPLGRAYRWGTRLVADTGVRLRLVQLLRVATLGRTQRTEQEAQAARLAALGLTDPEAAPYLAPAHPALAEAWRVTEGLLVALRDEVRASGAQLWIVTLSNSPQVHPDPAARRAFMRRIGAGDLFYADRRIQDLGARAGIPVITLALPLAEHAQRHGSFLHGFPASTPGVGHWNETGTSPCG